VSVRVGVRLPPCRPVGEVAAAAVAAERLGFDEVWVPDSQLLWRDPFVTLAAVAQATTRLGLGTAVTNVVTRHPAVLASAARTVGELAEGRFVLGVGVGNSSVEPVGLRPSTQAELRDRLSVVRSLLGGDAVDFGPVASSLREPGTPPPVLMAASGPRNLRLAGEIADGAILLSGISPATLASSRERVAEGAAAAGRQLSDVQLVVSTFAHVTDDIERDARQLKPICAGIAQKGGGPALALAGIPIQVPDRVEGIYPDLVHAEDWDLAVERCGEWVSDADVLRFAQQFCLFGTLDEVRARLAEVEQAGATSVFLQHVGSYTLPYELMESFAEVLPPGPAPLR
jgi:5,10-methylenetetrahydromethanopterin reductase